MYLDTSATERLSELALYSRIWWALAGISLVLLTLFTLRLGSRLQLRRARRAQGLVPLQLLRLLHRSDSATASIEYLLVLFPFLVIVMTFWQFAFMFNAQLFMGYSAFAAARSAAVVIYEENQHEAEGILRNTEATASADDKWTSIRNAAVVGTLPISPGQSVEALGVVAGSVAKSLLNGESSNLELSGDMITATLPRISLMTLHYGDMDLMTVNRRLERAGIKSVYADVMTTVYVNGYDNRGNDFEGENKIAEQQDLSDEDVINVTVKYVFGLNVPFVGRLLEIAFASEGLKGILEAFRNPNPSMILTETMSMKAWRRLRATEPCK